MPITIIKYVSYGAILLKFLGIVSVSVFDMIWFGLAVMVVCIGGGVLIVKTGIVKYVKSLDNGQNEELLMILDAVKKTNEKEKP